MQKLSGLDSSFLLLETGTTTGHVGGVLIFDETTAPSPVTLSSLTRLIGERLPLAPLFRRRLVTVPMGLDHPYWVEDPDFDLEFHVRHTAIPSPGTDEQLAALVGWLHSQPLDLRRPLWEMYLITGIPGNRMAIYGKVHHAAIDGASGAELMAALLDLDPAGREVPSDNWEPEQLPTDVELLVRAGVSLVRQPWNAIQLAGSLLKTAPELTEVVRPYADDLIGRVAGRPDADGGVIVRAPVLPPDSLINGPVTAHRRWAFATVSLDDVKAVKNAYAVTVNDVVMAMTAGVLRRWFTEHGDLPDGPLVAMVPVSVRTAGERANGGNKISLMLAALPTDVEDPTERLLVSHRATKVAKEQHAAMPTGLVEDVTEFMVPGILGRAARASVSLGILQRANPSNLIVSNVPGPNVPIYLAGAQMVAYYPVSALPDGQGLNVSVVGYLGGMHFGLLADREMVPDVDEMTGYLRDELDLLLEAVPR